MKYLIKLTFINDNGAAQMSSAAEIISAVLLSRMSL